MNAARSCLEHFIPHGPELGPVDAAASKKSLSMRKMADSLKLSPPISTARHLTRFVIAVTSASITYLNEQIHKLVVTIFHSQNTPLIQKKIIQPTSNLPIIHTPAEPPVPPNLLDMPQKFVIDILNHLALKDITACASVSKGLNSYTDSPDPWRTWAARLSMPWEKEEDVKKKMITLLTYFKINPTTGQPTTLKSTENIEKALAAYPFPAKVIIPNLTTAGFQLYYREASGSFHSIDVEDEDQVTENRVEANKIFNDITYAELEVIN